MDKDKVKVNPLLSDIAPKKKPSSYTLQATGHLLKTIRFYLKSNRHTKKECLQPVIKKIKDYHTHKYRQYECRVPFQKWA
jgi:hypothetical protein